MMMITTTKFIIIIINCNWVVVRWEWLFYMYTKYEINMKYEISPFSKQQGKRHCCHPVNNKIQNHHKKFKFYIF